MTFFCFFKNVKLSLLGLLRKCCVTAVPYASQFEFGFLLFPSIVQPLFHSVAGYIFFNGCLLCSGGVIAVQGVNLYR